MELNTPKRIKTITSYINSPPSSECSVLNTSWNYNNVDGPESPNSSCGSPEFIARQHQNYNSSNNSNNSSNDRESRRGRPRSEALPTLMYEGTTSPSAIKCKYCHRVFPREKSLQAHLRTHTGERPYTCDYPGCTRAFTQSGQLKTHQRLHTGERPFICAVPSCQMRFTHANRHCPDHPYDQLKRCDDFIIQPIPEQNSDVIKWLEKYRLEREERTPTRKTPKRKEKDNNNENVYGTSSENDNCPVTPSNPFKSRKGLMVELDMNAGLGSSPLTGKHVKPNPKVLQWQEPLSQEEDSGDELETPVYSTFNPKKRWLREAWQDDLAKPLEPAINPNYNRPTVLMVASKDKTMPLSEIQNCNKIPETILTHSIPTPPSPVTSTSTSTGSLNTSPVVDENRKWLGALALMELATEDGQLALNDNQNNSVIQSYTQL